MGSATAVFSSAILLVASVCLAQGLHLNPDEQRAIVEKTLKLVSDNYVFPERVKDIESALTVNLRAGKYNSLVALDEFLAALNYDMQSAGRDRHLRIVSNPRIVSQLKQEAMGSAESSPLFLKMLRENNFRLRKAESLDGNIGYFKLDNFVELRHVKDALVGAMNFLSHSSGLILDLTDNGGGASETADFLLSYFLPEGTITGESWSRASGRWTVSKVARMPEARPMYETPLYILVSERTASAAEAVAYTLQQAKRAVVAGSRTRGMANAGVQLIVNDRLFVIVPTMRNINAVTRRNWEGVGVEPDIPVEPGKAMPAAMANALKLLAEQRTDRKEKFALLFLAAEYESILAPETPAAGLLNLCAGEYEGGRKIELRSGVLYFIQGAAARRLTYMKEHTFLVEGRRDYRLRFHLEDGKASSLEVLWNDGSSDTYGRTR